MGINIFPLCKKNGVFTDSVFFNKEFFAEKNLPLKVWGKKLFHFLLSQKLKALRKSNFRQNKRIVEA